MTMIDPFSSASSFDRIQDFEGQLLLVTPLEYLEGLNTSFGDNKDAVDADLVVLDAEDGPEEYSSVRIFPGALIGTLKRAAKLNQTNPMGDPTTGFLKMVLGRLGKGEAKKGMSAPWILQPPTEEDKKSARGWIAELRKRRDEDPFA